MDILVEASMGSPTVETFEDNYREELNGMQTDNVENDCCDDGHEENNANANNEDNVESDMFKVDEGFNMENVDFINTTKADMKLYHFGSRDVAFDFYDMYAKKKGFAARRWNVVKNKNGEVSQQTFVCFKQGYRLDKYLKRKNQKRVPRALTRCGCNALLHVRFRTKWNEMINEFQLHDNQWIKEVYEKRKIWATAHIRGNFFAGFRTTSRCEGMHAQVGRFVHYRNNLTEFLKQFSRYLAYIRQREVEADFESIIGEPVLQTSMEDIERSAARLYTRKLFLLFRPVLERACGVKVVACEQTLNGMIYVMSKQAYPTRQWYVSMRLKNCRNVLCYNGGPKMQNNALMVSRHQECQVQRGVLG
ncbi:FAR1 DNA-binding domain [Sesbania bispinosa]|nr:FAR1 DNA-binding domain [Sesbania bispinosa]